MADTTRFDIDSTLLPLDADALYRLAEWHDKNATVIRARAHSLVEYYDMREKVDRKIEFLKALPKTTMKYLRQGHPLDKALELTAQHSDVPLATVKTHWKDFTDLREGDSMAHRNRLIMDLAALGLKNAQIGERVGLHPISVSRIISKEKRTRLYWQRNEYSRMAVPEAEEPEPQKTPITEPATLKIVPQ